MWYCYQPERVLKHACILASQRCKVEVLLSSSLPTLLEHKIQMLDALQAHLVLNVSCNVYAQRLPSALLGLTTHRQAFHNPQGKFCTLLGSV